MGQAASVSIAFGTNPQIGLCGVMDTMTLLMATVVHTGATVCNISSLNVTAPRGGESDDDEVEALSTRQRVGNQNPAAGDREASTGGYRATHVGFDEVGDRCRYRLRHRRCAGNASEPDQDDRRGQDARHDLPDPMVPLSGLVGVHDDLLLVVVPSNYFPLGETRSFLFEVTCFLVGTWTRGVMVQTDGIDIPTSETNDYLQCWNVNPQNTC